MSHETPEEWTDEQNALFSRIFVHMQGNQWLFTHPKATKVPDEHWCITCWNAAWMAAECHNQDHGPMVFFDENEVEIGAEILAHTMKQ